MKNLLSTFALFLTLTTTAMAGTTVLNVEIGKTTRQQFVTEMETKAELINKGVNKYSSGEMLQTSGKAYDIEGLYSVLFIFDANNLLAGVVMNMNKNAFDRVYLAIGSKYKVVKLEKPFVGNRYAKFKTKDATIEIVAPHLSFEMDVNYLSTELEKQFKKISQEESNAKKRQEASQF